MFCILHLSCDENATNLTKFAQEVAVAHQGLCRKFKIQETMVKQIDGSTNLMKLGKMKVAAFYNNQVNK